MGKVVYKLPKTSGRFGCRLKGRPIWSTQTPVFCFVVFFSGGGGGIKGISRIVIENVQLGTGKVLSSCFFRQATEWGVPPYYMMVRVALWDRCTDALRVLPPSHDAPRSLFARAKPAPGDEAGIFVSREGAGRLLKYERAVLVLISRDLLSIREP